MAFVAQVLMFSLRLALGRALWNTLTQMPCTDVTMLQLLRVIQFS